MQSPNDFNLYKTLQQKLYSTRENRIVPLNVSRNSSWLTVKFRCIYKLLTIVYNSLKEGRTNLSSKKKLIVKHSQRSTRNSAQDNNTINLVTPFNRRRKIYADHGFTFTAAQQWNKLPSHIKNSTNIKEFKKPQN